jgi:hypothetical protein
MIIAKEFPNKTFATKEELFKELKANKEIIIEAKKAEIYKSCDKGLSVSVNQEQVNKMLGAVKGLDLDKDYYYFAVNTSKILDSHRDLHIDGNWDKTVREQQGKVYLVFDHTLKRSEIIAMKGDIEMFTAIIPFSMVGKSYTGETYALIYKIKKDKIVNAEAKEWLEKGYDFEASVRMQYMDIDLALDSNNQDNLKEKEAFDKYYGIIANKEDFENINYFWVVKQAKNVMESSLVLFGSNSATGSLQENKSEADDFTSENTEPSDDTQKQADEKAHELLKQLLNKF